MTRHVAALLMMIFGIMSHAQSSGSQSTNIAIPSGVLQPSVKRLGINLGTLNNYDSGQMVQNLITANPGFEGQVWNSTIRCAYGTATSCIDENPYSGWAAGFWAGATYQVFYGAAAGRSGTVSGSSAAGNGYGITLDFADSGVAPAQGDYVIVRKTVPGSSSTGWFPYTSGNGSVSDNLTDPPPGTLGKQTTVLSAPTANDFATLSFYFDSSPGRTFVQFNGTYQLQFKAKSLGGTNQAYVSVIRYGVASYINQIVTLSNTWQTYNLTFTANENGSAIGTVGVGFGTDNASTFELDDVSLTPVNGDPTNTTVFRDSVVNALRTLQPGTLRYWGDNGQLGETLDNLLTPQFGRQLASFSPYGANTQLDYGLHEFLQLAQLVGAEPWFVVPSTFSLTDASNLIQYLGGSTSTPYGAKRAALGQATPWTQVFSKIHLEFGNEAWNGIFKGGTIEYPAPYGGQAQAIFAAMQANPAFVASSYDLVLGSQAYIPTRTAQELVYCTNANSLAIAPYTMNDVSSFSTNELLFGSTFAEPEAFMSANGTAEGLTPGVVYQHNQLLESATNPVSLSFYEINLSTLGGGITQQALNNYTPSLGAGLMVADTMLQAMATFGVVNQELFALPQYSFSTNGNNILLWGSVIDMGVTNRKRPQYLALELANQALSNGATMLPTIQSGANPTWNEPLTNTVQYATAHYIQSYAFSQGQNLSAVLFNLSRSTALPVTFSGTNAPGGTVQMQQLTSANVTDTNENSNVISITPSTLSQFNPSAGLTLPPYSMTVLTWSQQTSAPAISGVTTANITGTSATITWTTDQSSSSQVYYGTSTTYGSASALNSTLSTSHSVTLTGLSPSTTYDFQVVSANATGAASSSANLTLTTSAQAPVISAVSTSSVTSTSATVTWTTDQASSSLVNFGTSTGYGSASTVNASLSTSHSVTLTGLQPGTTYNFDVVSANFAGTSATSANATFVTTAVATTTPLPIMYVGYWGITTSGIDISWSTDIAANTSVLYGTTPSLGQSSPVQPALVNGHGVVLSGLNPGTTYYFEAQSTAANGSTGVSSMYSFTTIPTQGPTISNIVVTPGANNTAQITWTTSTLASSYVAYGPTTAYNRWSTTTSAVTNAAPTMGWVPSGVIHFQLWSLDLYGHQTISPDYTFVEP